MTVSIRLCVALGATALALTIAGCATVDYVAPPPGTASAEATFRTLVGVGTNISIVSDETCKRGPRVTVALFTPLRGTRDAAPKPIPAGRKLVFQATSDFPVSPTLHKTCMAMASVTPEAGHRYEITHESCGVLAITEAGTYQSAPSYAPIAVPKSCW